MLIKYLKPNLFFSINLEQVNSHPNDSQMISQFTETFLC